MKAKIRKTQILGVLFNLIVGIALWILVVSPRLEQPALLETQIAQAIASKQSLDSQVDTIIASQKDLSTAQLQINALAERFPSEGNAPEFQDQITEAITKAGISAVNIKTISLGKAAVGATEVQSADMSVEIAVSGSYSQLTALLGNLYGIKRALAIDSISLAGNAGGDPNTAFELRVSGRTFLFPAIPPISPELFK